ncbi:MAG: ribosome maturation factor RimM [Rickettsiales bacterium]
MGTPAPSPVVAEEPWVALAVFTQPHGVSGRIKVKSFTEPADDFSKTPNLTDARGNLLKLKITGHTQGMAIVEIEGITKREQAELLRGVKIGVARAAMPVLKNPNQYYTDDLVGMAVVEANGTSFGMVRRVANYGAGDILDITRINGNHEMYSFTNATFPMVDLKARQITIEPPEILDSSTKDDEYY